MMTSPSFAYLSYISFTCGMASAQNGQSKAQKSISTTLPRSLSNLSGGELIQVSPSLSSGAFWPTKTSSGCCAHATAVVSSNANIDRRSIVVLQYSGAIKNESQLRVNIDVSRSQVCSRAALARVQAGPNAG